jgi:hypothetical protein
MPKYANDDEFIEAWNRLKSPTKVGKYLNMDRRSAMFRRRSIEARYGISLESENKKFQGGIKTEAGNRANKLAVERVKKYERDMVEEIKDGIIFIASDCHYWPGIVTTAHQAFCRLAKELSPKIVILNGDVLDGARISRHARIMWEKQPTVKDEIAAVQDRVAEIERAVGKAKLIRNIGNHDARFENYLSTRIGEFEEMTGMTLLDYLPRWRAGWCVHINHSTDGWLAVRHRPVSGGIHAAYNSVLRSGTHYAHGHLHKLQVTPWGDYRGRRYGIDTGSLAEPNGPQFNYTEAGPVNWASGFVVLTYYKGRLLPPETVVVDGDAAWFRGTKI